MFAFKRESEELAPSATYKYDGEVTVTFTVKIIAVTRTLTLMLTYRNTNPTKRGR